MPPDNSSLYETPWPVASAAECNFCHTTDIPGHGQVEGQWDLRGGVGDYLGHYDFNGQRVLEIGAATGFLTFEMEKTAREVLGFTKFRVSFHQKPADGRMVPQFTVVASRAKS